MALWMYEDSHWGYEPEARPDTRDGSEVVITLKVGDTLKVDGIRQSSSRSSKDHFFTIEALGVDLPLAFGNAGPREFTFEEAGTQYGSEPIRSLNSPSSTTMVSIS